jgi:hypothetical protein
MACRYRAAAAHQLVRDRGQPGTSAHVPRHTFAGTPLARTSDLRLVQAGKLRAVVGRCVRLRRQHGRAMLKWIFDWAVPMALLVLGAVGVSDLCGLVGETEPSGTLVFENPRCVT